MSGFSLSVSAARAAATPSAVDPTLSVMSQESLSVRGIVAPPVSSQHRRLRGPAVRTLGRDSSFTFVEELKAPDGLAEWMSEQGLGDGPLEDVSQDQRRNAEHHAALHPLGPTVCAAPRPRAPPPAQQRRDHAGNRSSGGAGRNRRAASSPDRQLRRHRRDRRRGLLSDGAGRRLQRRRGTAGTARRRCGCAFRNGAVDGRLAGQARCGRLCRGGLA